MPTLKRKFWLGAKADGLVALLANRNANDQNHVNKLSIRLMRLRMLQGPQGPRLYVADSLQDYTKLVNILSGNGKITPAGATEFMPPGQIEQVASYFYNSAKSVRNLMVRCNFIANDSGGRIKEFLIVDNGYKNALLQGWSQSDPTQPFVAL